MSAERLWATVAMFTPESFARSIEEYNPPAIAAIRNDLEHAEALASTLYYAWCWCQEHEADSVTARAYLVMLQAINIINPKVQNYHGN